MDSSTLDRRQFLALAALNTLAASGLALGGAGAAAAAGPPSGAPDPAIFAALLAFQGAVIDRPWTAAEVAQHVGEFDALCASADAGTRAFLRTTLEAVVREAALLRGSSAQALEAIRGWDRASSAAAGATGGFPSRRAHLTTLRQAIQDLCPVPADGDAYWLVGA